MNKQIGNGPKYCFRKKTYSKYLAEAKILGLEEQMKQYLKTTNNKNIESKLINMLKSKNDYKTYLNLARIYNINNPGLEKRVSNYIRNSTNTKENKIKHLHKIITNVQQQKLNKQKQEINNIVRQHYPNNNCNSITSENLRREFGSNVGSNAELEELMREFSGGKKSKKNNNKARNF